MLLHTLSSWNHCYDGEAVKERKRSSGLIYLPSGTESDSFRLAKPRGQWPNSASALNLVSSRGKKETIHQCRFRGSLNSDISLCDLPYTR